MDAAQHRVNSVKVRNSIFAQFASGHIPVHRDDGPTMPRILGLPAHLNPLAGAIRAPAKHFQWPRVDGTPNQRVISAFKLPAGGSENYFGRRRHELLARRIVRCASSIVDMNKSHAEAIDQIDRIDDCIHGLAEAARGLLTSLLLGYIDVHDYDAVRMDVIQGRHCEQEPQPSRWRLAGIFERKARRVPRQNGADSHGGLVSVERAVSSRVSASLQVIESNSVFWIDQRIRAGQLLPGAVHEDDEPHGVEQDDMRG